MDKTIVRIRTALMPKYYKDFHCLAGDCRDNCCRKWFIGFSKKDYLALRRLEVPADYKQRLDKAVCRLRQTEEDTIFYAQFQRNEEGCCPLQDEDGLCTLQKTCGHAALPAVCRNYPRLQVYTVAGKELVLSPSCEGVLALLWDLPEGVDFLEEPLPRPDWRVTELKREDRRMAFEFPAVRSMCVDILQTRRFPLSKRMILMGVALQDLMSMDWTHPDTAAWCARSAALLESPETGAVLDTLRGNRQIFLSQNCVTAFKLRRDDNSMPQEIVDAMGLTAAVNQEGNAIEFQYDTDCYDRYLAVFEETFKDREYFFENLMVAVMLYIIFPTLNTRESLWKDYVDLCNLYSFFRFASVVGCAKEPTQARLFHVLAIFSRFLLHNGKQQAALQDEFFQHDSATLAHMAIMLGG